MVRLAIAHLHGLHRADGRSRSAPFHMVCMPSVALTRIDTVHVDACYGYARHAHYIAGGDGINERATLSCPPRPPITLHTQGK
jgi:hypothetical protein